MDPIYNVILVFHCTYQVIAGVACELPSCKYLCHIYMYNAQIQYFILVTELASCTIHLNLIIHLFLQGYTLRYSGVLLKSCKSISGLSSDVPCDALGH